MCTKNISIRFYHNYFFSIVVWSYYAYFVAVVLNAMAPSPAEQVPLLQKQFYTILDDSKLFDAKVICAVVFHCLTALFAWSYAMVIFTPPGFAPPSWHLSLDQVVCQKKRSGYCRQSSRHQVVGARIFSF